MSDRQISCEGCSAQMGTIRDARLRKDIKYFCTSCVNVAAERISRLETEVRNMRNADNLRMKSGRHDLNDIFGDSFSEMFGGKRR